MTDTAEALQRLLVALLAGLLVGLDRERAEERKQRKLFAGIRTFPLIALLGAGLALPAGTLGPWLAMLGLAAVALVTAISYRQTVQNGDVGATTEIAALLIYAIGVLAGLGQLVVAAAAAVAVAVLLAAKPPLERLSRAMSEDELLAVLKLAVITAIVLPLVPDRGYGPWDVWNPYRIWTVVVLVSAVSFAGFVATRLKGDNGLLWAAGLGALVSSTAVTVAMAQRSKAQPAEARLASAAAILASTVMAVRVLVLVALVRPSLLGRLAPPVAAMALLGLAGVFWLRRTAEAPAETKRDSSMRNPFSVRAALVFGALFAAALLLVRASRAWLGDTGTLVAAVLSGFVDVDAISLAIARGAEGPAVSAAAVAIVVACASNNLFKATVALVGGAGRLRRDVPLALLAMSAAGGAVVALTARW